MAPFYLAVDVGATKIDTVVGNEDGFVSEPRSVPTQDHWSVEGLRDVSIETVERTGKTMDDIAAVGLGLPSIVDTTAQRMLPSPQMTGLDLGLLEGAVGTRIVIENDANAAVLGEKRFGDGGVVDNLLTLVLGTGIGAGVYYDGRLLKSGTAGRGPEPGYILLEDGRYWQDCCAGGGIPAYVASLLETEERETILSVDGTASQLFAAAETDTVAADYVDQLATLNAQGIAAVVNLYAPELLTVVGSVATKNPAFMQNVFERVDRYLRNPLPTMKISVLGNAAGLYGALALAQEQY